MQDHKNCHLGILYLTHLLISADGVIDINEYDALGKIKDYEKIPDETLKAFEVEIKGKSEKQIYQAGIDHLGQCSDEDKINAFVHLYKMSEADGRVHVKEVRLLLYSIRMSGIEFNDVVQRAKQVKY
ncbi:MAG: hypothetical protein RIB47_13300 [Cyclobacteriaceae bacterium]